MDYLEGLKVLKKRFDECLVQHAETIDKNDVGEIYKLQAYAETHYYMKAVHDYNAAEVEALLSFFDPLEVAFWCREENTHKIGLPICDILKEIHADERFKKISPAVALTDKTAKLIRRLESSLYGLVYDIQLMDSVEVGRRSERIAARLSAFRYTTDRLMDNSVDEYLIDFLLNQDDPLLYITEHWPESTLFGEDVLDDIKDKIKEQRQPKSVHERLKEASRSVQEQMTSEKTQRSTGAR